MSLIDDLTPKMQKAAAENTAKSASVPNRMERLYSSIVSAIEDRVRKTMLSGNQPPDIKDYYCSRVYLGEDIPDEYYLSETEFTVLELNSDDMLYLKGRLEHAIKEKIGYRYCELVFEDKIQQYDHRVKEVFGSGMKWKTSRRNGKAIWIHATMSDVGFDRVKSRGPTMIYNKTRGFS